MCVQSSHICESDRASRDLITPLPSYTAGIYLSEKCRPSAGERMLLRSLSQRHDTTVHDAALAASANQAVAADNMQDFIRVCQDFEWHYVIGNI